jgi:hypothetical protein
MWLCCATKERASKPKENSMLFAALLLACMLFAALLPTQTPHRRICRPTPF